MPAFEVVSENAEFSVGFRPSVPGANASLAGITGRFELEFDNAGDVDLSQPVTGHFETLMDELQVGNSVVSAIAKLWLGGDDEIAARGTVTSVARREASPAKSSANRRASKRQPMPYDLGLSMEFRGASHALMARSGFEQDRDGNLAVWGGSRFHPCDVGIPIPRLLSPQIETRWTVALERC